MTHWLGSYVYNSSIDKDNLLTKLNATDDRPAWSPDGEKIVFSSNRSGNWDLWLINADGSDLTQLTDDAFYDNFPDW